jgi:4-amino-4-deoxy-L-arabinose transferase-like glycosyltransferase
VSTHLSGSRAGTLCVLVVGVFFLSTIRDGHDWGDDFSQYILHAEALATGAAYAPTRYLYNADSPLIGPPQYPPGFPVALAPVVWLFGLDLWPMKAEVVLFFVGALFIVHRLVLPLMPPASAAAVVLIVGLNPYFWDFKDQILSDVPFFFFFVATLLCLTSADDTERSARQRVALALLGGAAMYAAYATRTVGVSLLPSLIARDFIHHRRLTRESFVAGATFVVLAGVHHFTWGETSYTITRPITTLTVSGNLVSYLRWLSDIWSNGYLDLIRKGLFLVTLMLAALGYVSLWRQRKAMLWVVTPLFYLAIILVWPFSQDTRFLIPVIPIYVVCCVLGASSIDHMIARRGGKSGVVLGVFLAVVGASYVARYSTLPFGRLQEGISKRESVELFEFVKTTTRRDDIIVFSRPRALALFGQRTVTPPSRPADPCRLWVYMRRIGAAYLVTGPSPAANSETRYLAGFVRDFASNLREVMRNADVAVYQVESPPARCIEQSLAIR